MSAGQRLITALFVRSSGPRFTFHPKRPSASARSVFVALILVVSAVAVAVPVVLPARAQSSYVQTDSTTCSGCTSISLTFPTYVESGDALAVMVCWSGSVTGESFSDSSTTNVYQEVISQRNGVECAAAWTRASNTVLITENVSWSGSVDAILNTYETFGSDTTITVLRTPGSGTGAAFSLDSTSRGPRAAELACYGTVSSVTLTAGPSFILDGTSDTGGCEHGVNLNNDTAFPMTASSSVSWAGIGLVIEPAATGETQCTASARTNFSCITRHNTNQLGIGDLLVVSASRTDPGGTWSISDNMSSEWTPIGSVANVAKAQAWYTVAKGFGYDEVTVNFNDLSTQQVTLTLMSCGNECTNQSVTYSTGTGTGTSFSVASQTVAIGPAFATIATTSFPGNVTGGPGYYAWWATNTGSIEVRDFTSQTSNTCPASGTYTVTWAEICVSFRAGVVEKLDLESGADTAPITPANHFTVSYKLDGLSKSLSLEGTIANWVDDQSDTDSISPNTAGSTSMHQWAILFSGGAAVSQTWPSGHTAMIVSERYLYYEQYENTFEITPFSPSAWDASRTISIDGVQLGMDSAAATFTPPSGSGAQSASVWTDRGQYVVWQPSTGGTPSQSWIPNPIQSPPIFSGGATYNSNYTLQSVQTTATVTTTSVTTATTTETTASNSTITSATTETATQTVTSVTTSTITGTPTTMTTTATIVTTTTMTGTNAGPTTVTTTFYTTETETHSVATTATTTVITPLSTTTETQTVTRAPTATVVSPTTTTSTVVSSVGTQTVTSSIIETVTSSGSITATITVPTTTTAISLARTTTTSTAISPTTTTETLTPGATTYSTTVTKTTTQGSSWTTELSYFVAIPPLILLLVVLLVLRRRYSQPPAA